MTFRDILSAFVVAHPDVVIGAVFCDEEGERVEAFAVRDAVDAFELDLRGAQYAPAARTLAPRALLRIDYERQVDWVHALVDGYYLVVIAAPSRRQGALRAPLARVAAAVIAEM